MPHMWWHQLGDLFRFDKAPYTATHSWIVLPMTTIKPLQCRGQSGAATVAVNTRALTGNHVAARILLQWLRAPKVLKQKLRSVVFTLTWILCWVSCTGSSLTIRSLHGNTIQYSQYKLGLHGVGGHQRLHQNLKGKMKRIAVSRQWQWISDALGAFYNPSCIQ